jgi:hypothetical protein
MVEVGLAVALVELQQPPLLQAQQELVAAVAVDIVVARYIAAQMVERVQFGQQLLVELLALAVAVAVVLVVLAGVLLLEKARYMVAVALVDLELILAAKVLLFLPITQDQLLPMQPQAH